MINNASNLNNNIKLVKNSICPGPSGALRTGFLEASAPFILVTMADLSDELVGVDYYITLLNKEVRIVSFSRFCLGGKVILNKPQYLYVKKRIKHTLKVLFPKIAGKMIKYFSGISTVDPTNSYKLYSSEMLKKLDLKSTISFSVTLEIVMKSFALGYKIREVPTVWEDRSFGESNFPLTKSLISYLPLLVVILFRNRLFSFNNNYLSKLFGKGVVDN